MLAPKKSVALQAGRQSSVGIAPILSGSGAGVTASLTGQVLPTMTPVPLTRQVGVGDRGTPSEVAEQPVMEVIPLPTTGLTRLLAMLVVSTVAGAM